MTGRLVKIERHFDNYAWTGFVCGETESLMLVQFVSDRYDLDGYRCIRKKDISVVTDDFMRKDFVQRALRCKGIQSAAPEIEVVDDIRAMIHAISTQNQIITIHRELVHPDECEIGKIHEADEDSYVLDWITPNGEWEPDERRFQFDEVTRLDWCDEYSRTLLLVNADRNGE